VNVRDSRGRTAVLLAARSLSVDALKVLLESDGVDLSVLDRDGKHALSLAEGVEWKAGKEEVRQMLKEADKREGGEWNCVQGAPDL